MKDQTILSLKGLAIIGVVLQHISNRRFDAPVDVWIHSVDVWFAWCVLGFFCVSGYLHALSDSRKSKPALEFIRVRFNRLLVPFFILVFVYSVIWQVLQAVHLANIGVMIPPDFIGKLKQALWPVDSWVAQQLYFFPLLFGISVVAVLLQKGLGIYGMWAAVVIVAAFGPHFYPIFLMGFTWGVFFWGIGFYSAGYLLFHYRQNPMGIRIALLVATIYLAITNGYVGPLRCIPLWLLAEGHTLRFDRVPLLGFLGDASGTIYIYHTPFIIQPLVIAATHLHGPVPQFIGALGAAATAIAICCAIYAGLRNTRAKVLLL